VSSRCTNPRPLLLSAAAVALIALSPSPFLAQTPNPVDATAALAAAQEALRTTGPEAALAVVEDALRQGKRAWEVYDLQGQLLQDLGQDRQAETAWRRALQVNPQAKSPRASLARSRVQAGLWLEAVELYQEALAAAPDDVDAGLALARLYWDHQQTARAAEVVRALAEAHPDEAAVQLALAEEFAGGLPAETLEPALKHGLTQADEGVRLAVLKALGRLYTSQGRGEEASAMYAAALPIELQRQGTVSAECFEGALEPQERAARDAMRAALASLAAVEDGTVARERAHRQLAALGAQIEQLSTTLDGIEVSADLATQKASRALGYSRLAEAVDAATGFLDTGDAALSALATENFRAAAQVLSETAPGVWREAP